jgi:hypothetical protein
VEDPGFGMIRTIGHAGDWRILPLVCSNLDMTQKRRVLTRLECMKRLLAQCQIAGRVLLSHVLRFVCVTVRDRHVGVEDGKLGYSRLLRTSHGGFAYTRSWSICTDDYGP